jgi:hypothetical protein
VPGELGHVFCICAAVQAATNRLDGSFVPQPVQLTLRQTTATSLGIRKHHRESEQRAAAL